MGIQAKLRRVLAGAGALGVGLAVVGFSFPPVPVPTVTPSAPAPMPSIAAAVGQLLSPGSSGSTGTAPAAQTARPAASRSGAPPSSAAGLSAVAAAQSAQPATKAVSTPAQTAAVATAVRAAHTGRQASAFPTGAGASGGLGGAPIPFAPAVLAALVVLLGFFGLRMTAPAPAVSRRLRLRVGVSSVAPGAPAGAALAAATRLLESTLPAGFTVRRAGESAVLVEAPALHRALLYGRLQEIAARAARVGLRLEWSAEEPAHRPSPRIRLAAG